MCHTLREKIHVVHTSVYIRTGKVPPSSYTVVALQSGIVYIHTVCGPKSTTIWYHTVYGIHDSQFLDSDLGLIWDSRFRIPNWDFHFGIWDSKLIWNCKNFGCSTRKVQISANIAYMIYNHTTQYFVALFTISWDIFDLSSICLRFV